MFTAKKYVQILTPQGPIKILSTFIASEAITNCELIKHFLSQLGEFGSTGQFEINTADLRANSGRDNEAENDDNQLFKKVKESPSTDEKI